MSDMSKLSPMITIEFMKDILVKEYNKFCGIIQIESKAGSKAGDNNLSDICRITVKFRNGEEIISKIFIVKFVKLELPLFVKLARGIEKENAWYEEALPEIEKLGVDICSKCYAVTEDFLIFDDLCDQGYKVVDRHVTLDTKHCIKAVEALAKFHAVTHYLYSQNKLSDIIMKDTLSLPEVQVLTHDRYNKVGKVLSCLNSMGITKYNDVLNEFIKNGFQRMEKCMGQEHNFRCLVHGDFWTTNMLFKYDSSNQVDHAKMIDFQLIRLSIPSYDLHFLIATSLQAEERNEDNLNRIFNAYLTELNRTLEYLSCDDLLTKESFDQMMSDTSFIGVFVTLTFLPVVSCEKPLVLSPPQGLTEQEKMEYSPFDVVYREKTYQKRLMSLLDYFIGRRVI